MAKPKPFQEQVDLVINTVGKHMPGLTGKPGVHHTSSMTDAEKLPFDNMATEVLGLFGIKDDRKKPEPKHDKYRPKPKKG